MSLLTLDQIHLASGSHDAPGVEMCFMEAAAYIAGEPHSDHPACVCSMLAAFLRSWNDSLLADSPAQVRAAWDAAQRAVVAAHERNERARKTEAANRAADADARRFGVQG